MQSTAQSRQINQLVMVQVMLLLEEKMELDSDKDQVWAWVNVSLTYVWSINFQWVAQETQGSKDLTILPISIGCLSS